MREKIFKDYKHILVRVRFPLPNHTDVLDKYDYDAAMQLLYKEWAQVREQVDQMFGIIKIEPTKEDKPLRLS